MNNNNKNSESNHNDDEILGTYETLEQANDRAMEKLESNHKEFMQYEESEPDDEGPQEIGLYSFVHKDQDLKDEENGLTWDIDDAGCLMFCNVDEEGGMEYVVEKRKKSIETGK